MPTEASPNLLTRLQKIAGHNKPAGEIWDAVKDTGEAVKDEAQKLKWKTQWETMKHPLTALGIAAAAGGAATYGAGKIKKKLDERKGKYD